MGILNLIKKRMIKPFNTYQRYMWYCSVTGGELSKPMRFYNEAITIFNTSLLLTLLKDTENLYLIVIKWIGIYILIMLIAIFIGKFLVKVGVVRYNTDLANKQNEIILDIQKKVNKLCKVKN